MGSTAKFCETGKSVVKSIEFGIEEPKEFKKLGSLIFTSPP